MFKLTVRSIRIISYVTLTAFLAAIIVVARTPVEAALQGMDQGAGLGARGNSGLAPQARREIDRTTSEGAVAAPAVKPNYWSVPLHVRATLPGVVAANARITLTPNYWSAPFHVRATLVDPVR